MSKSESSSHFKSNKDSSRIYFQGNETIQFQCYNSQEKDAISGICLIII